MIDTGETQIIFEVDTRLAPIREVATAIRRALDELDTGESLEVEIADDDIYRVLVIHQRIYGAEVRS